MNRHEQLLRALLDALKIDARGRAYWFGVAIPFDPPLHTAPATGRPLRPGAGALAQWLYRYFYTAGTPHRPSPPRDPPVSWHDRRVFVRALAAAAKGMKPRSGRVSLSAGYVVIVGGTAANERSVHFDRRLYWNVTAEGAPPLLRALVMICRRARIPFALKALRDPSAYERCDSVVLLLPKEDYPRIAPDLAGVSLRHEAHLGVAVPALTKPLRPGVGLATSPPGQASFGEHRCELLASGLLDAADRARTQPVQRIEAIRARFAGAGISLDRPHTSVEEGDVSAWRPARRIARMASRRSTVGDRSRTRARLLGSAEAIADELRDRALFLDGGCTWLAEVWPPPPGAAPAADPTFAPLGHDLYAGVAGVGLTLAMVAARSRDRRMTRTATAALSHALTLVERRAAGFADGFHLGWAGTAWAAALGGALLANRSLVERSRRIARARALDPVAPGEFDLLNGAAGTMLGLALLAEALSDPSLLDPARRLATALERGADRRGRTASWSISGVSTDANLTGLSHGAAGVAHALLELSRVTGDFGPRRLADEAVRYERTYFDPAEGNWPDLRRRDGDGPARGVRRRFMVAWCHGAAGIGLARLHAAAVLDDSESRAEARQASATVRRDLSTRLEHSVLDLSLCHGALGPAMALCACAAHGLVGEARVEPLITEVAVRVERAAARERAGLHVRRQPGLFLGRAGIVFAAYALAGEPTPPVLLPTAISGLGGRNSP